MPTIRPTVVVDEEYVSQDKYTIDLDLPTSGLASTLWLIVHANKVSTIDGCNAWIRNLISSISVNQAGQAALNAAPPDIFQADYYYKTGKFPQCGTRRWETWGDIEEIVPILFGEKVDDPEHYIDFAKLNDPTLSVTYDLDATDCEAYIPWTDASYPRFTVIANLLQGAEIPASKGYYSLRQIEKYTPVNSQVKKVELKGPRPIKRVLFQYDLTNIAYAMRQSVDRIRLWGDNEAWIPFDMTSERFKNIVKMLFGTGVARGNFELWWHGKTINNIFDERDYIDLMLHDDITRAVYANGGSGHGFVFRLSNLSDGLPSGVAKQGYFEFAGIAPWAVYPIDMPKMMGMDHMDPEDHKPIFLELTHASGATALGGDIRVCVQDLVTT